MTNITLSSTDIYFNKISITSRTTMMDTNQTTTIAEFVSLDDICKNFHVSQINRKKLQGFHFTCVFSAHYISLYYICLNCFG